MVDEVDNRLVTMGAKRITALVEKDRPWAVGFWDSQGYQLDQAIVHYVQNLCFLSPCRDGEQKLKSDGWQLS